VAKPRPLNLFNRKGEPLPSDALTKAPVLQSMELSPDAEELAFTYQPSADFNVDIGILDLSRGTTQRFTTHPKLDGSALWSPQKDKVAYYRADTGVLVQPFPGNPGSEKLLWKDDTPTNKNLQDWSPDGKFILARRRDGDLWVVPVNGDPPYNLTKTPRITERDARFSHDGKWIAFSSDANQDGHFEVYLMPFQPGGERIPVSVGGGVQVRWPRQSEELFYVAPDGTLMAVKVTFPIGQKPKVETATRLFPTSILSRGDLNTLRQQYDVFPDGKRFLLYGAGEQLPITLVLHWKPPG